MPDGGVLVMAQRTHQRGDVARHRPLGLIAGAARPAVAGQVGADDAETRVDQPGRDAMPCGVRARMPVQQDHRRSRSTMAHPQHRVADIDLLQRKALEDHAPQHSRFKFS